MRRKDLEQMANKIRVLEGALHQYADLQNWTVVNSERFSNRDGLDPNIARKALEMGEVTARDAERRSAASPKSPAAKAPAKSEDGKQWIKPEKGD